MKTFISFFVAVIFAIAFVNCAPPTSDEEFDEAIKAKSKNAIDTAVAALEAKNSGKGLLGSGLNDLLIFLQSFVGPQIIGASNSVPFVTGIVDGALEGLSNGGLLGALGGASGAATDEFQRIGGEIGKGVIKGANAEDDERIAQDFDDAVELANAKQANDSDLQKVNNLVNLLLQFGTGLITPYLTTSLVSGVQGLIGGLLSGLSTGGLLGGLTDGLQGLFDSLAEGGLRGFGQLFDKIETLKNSS